MASKKLAFYVIKQSFLIRDKAYEDTTTFGNPEPLITVDYT
jgi:hypothetical protein